MSKHVSSKTSHPVSHAKLYVVWKAIEDQTIFDKVEQKFNKFFSGFFFSITYFELETPTLLADFCSFVHRKGLRSVADFIERKIIMK